MMRLIVAVVSCALFQMAASQLIWDIWQTTWNRNNLFKSLNPRPPLKFATPDAIGKANIVVNENITYQNIVGFGGSLTDSSAFLFNNLKAKNPANYRSLLNYLFNGTEGENAAGLSYLRVPLGATDFSPNTYSFNNVKGDLCSSQFSINSVPWYFFPILSDILSVNPDIKIHVVPWSPPGWMKSTGTMNGGTLNPTVINNYAIYLLKALEGFMAKGINVYAISIQNEPENSNPTYPTTTLSAATEAKIGIQLKALMRTNDFANVKLIGYEHNWNDALGYPVQLMKAAGDVFDGVAFHCYSGNVSQQGAFHKLYPNKEIYFTECSGVFGTDWWSDIKWYLDNIFIGALENNAKAALMWNLALDGQGSPKLPGTNSCGGPGCRGIVTIDSDGTWSPNQEFYSMSHVSKATIPRDLGGPSGTRIKTTIDGTLSWGLRVVGFSTRRLNPTDWTRYSLVVLNWDDSVGGWDPTPIETTILFRGVQARYTFPVGVTTLLWYATPSTAPSLKDLAAAVGPKVAQSKFDVLDQAKIP